MMAAQMGSLNALEQERENSFWRKWLRIDLPSADTMGRGFSRVNLDSIRLSIHHVYTRLKRNKALKKTHGFNVLILDGHEHTSSYLRCCSCCLRRRVHTREGDRIQYYHRNVVAMLLGEDFPVLKDERRDLMENAKGLFPYEKSWIETEGTTKRQLWDIEGFTSWASLGREVRVVRSLETKTVCRQRTGKDEKENSKWIWATLMFVLNLFRAFVYLNIKPCLGDRHSNLYFAKLIFAGLYEGTTHKILP